MFFETATKHASKLALIWGDQRWTWGQVLDAARRIAGGLRVQPGDRVGVFLPNAPETLFVHLGIQLAGAVRVPINSLYTVREAAHPIEFTGATLVVTDEARLAIAAEAAPTVPRTTPQALLASSPAAGTPPDDEHFSMFCFTSGTSGKPKGVPLKHINLEHNIRGLVEMWEWSARDTLVLCLPLMHLHGLGNGLNGWIATGCTLVLQEKFAPESALDAIVRSDATMFFGVPAMYHRMLEVPRRPLPSMRLWVSGSAPLDRSLEDRWEREYGCAIVNRYGMTETAMITANPVSAPRKGSVGKPLPGMDVRLLDSGEIVVRGPSVFSGYWGGEVDAATGHENGFFRTGDLGRIDEDGYVYITGRAKDIIISGGTNIAPVEIEEVLLQHPAVAEAIAIPIPDPALGEVIRAVVVPRAPLSADAVMEWCTQHLARYKRPRDVRIVDEPLPRNAMQKLDRKVAKARYGS